MCNIALVDIVPQTTTSSKLLLPASRCLPRLKHLSIGSCAVMICFALSYSSRDLTVATSTDDDDPVSLLTRIS